MTGENNIKQFTASDIEKYYKGLLSLKERHDLEKAALDDPFLSDALEGYNTPGVNTTADINELKSRLIERTTAVKGNSINTKPGTAFVWWKAAAMIILIGGAGFFIYRLAIVKPGQHEVAKLQEENKTVIPLNNDSLKNIPGAGSTEQTVPLADQDKASINTGTAANQNKNAIAPAIEMKKEFQTIATNDTLSSSAYNKDAEDLTSITPQKQEAEKFSTIETAKADNKIQDERSKQETGKIESLDKSYKSKPEVNNQSKDIKTVSKKSEPFKGNYFRGRVLDADNNPLPFANITNEADKVGTYADAKGNFTLTSPDSVMNVQIRSVGFENNNVLLNSNLSNNLVILQEDRKSLSEVVISNSSHNTNRMQELKEANAKIDEPEPADGWVNYDVYIINNLNIPEEKKINNRTGIVEITFDINKIGQPVNLKVEKSLCKACDDEAMRLIKEGPRWKKSKKNTRARVAVPFND